MGFYGGVLMNFKEWKTGNIDPKNIEVIDLQLCWNAALDEAVKVANNRKEVQPFGIEEEKYNEACFDIVEAIKELKE